MTYLLASMFAILLSFTVGYLLARRQDLSLETQKLFLEYGKISNTLGSPVKSYEDTYKLSDAIKEAIEQSKKADS